MDKTCKSEQLRKVQELCFACLELNLYLDSHPCDKNAIDIYNSLSSQFQVAVKAYEKKYGPLMNFGHSSSKCSWQWIEDPWPWEKEFYN